MSEAPIKSGNGAFAAQSQRGRYHRYHGVEAKPAPKLTPRYGRFYEGRQRDCRPAAQSGNREYTVANQAQTTDNGVCAISHTDYRGVCRRSHPSFMAPTVNLLKLLRKEKRRQY